LIAVTWPSARYRDHLIRRCRRPRRPDALDRATFTPQHDMDGDVADAAARPGALPRIVECRMCVSEI